MYFTSDSMLPENQQPLMITVAPFGSQCVPADYPEEISVSWKDQVQDAVDCYNAGATVLQVQMRDPKTGHTSKSIAECSDLIGMLRVAVPKMILQIDGSISFAPEQGKEANWTEINPKPDQVTIPFGTTMVNSLPLTKTDDAQGAHTYQHAVADATPSFYIERLKRLRAQGIQPYFRMAHAHHLDELEYLIRSGAYMGPVNHSLTAIGGSGFRGRNPFDFIEYVRRSPQGSVITMESSWRTVAPLAAMSLALGLHIRCGLEDNLRSSKGKRMTSMQQVDQVVRLAKELKRAVATADQARQMSKLGGWYDSVEKTLEALGLPPNSDCKK